jgi:hypothetical protein
MKWMCQTLVTVEYRWQVLKDSIIVYMLETLHSNIIFKDPNCGNLSDNILSNHWGDEAKVTTLS